MFLSQAHEWFFSSGLLPFSPQVFFPFISSYVGIGLVAGNVSKFLLPFFWASCFFCLSPRIHRCSSFRFFFPMVFFLVAYTKMIFAFPSGLFLSFPFPTKPHNAGSVPF